jgi:hypothetical protein
MSVTNFRTDAGSGVPSKITFQILQEKKRAHQPVTALTAYDYATARLEDEAGVDLILVGDSLAMVVMGYDTTLPVTVDEMLHHTRAVRRAVKRAIVAADMPFGSYHTSVAEGVANAVRFVKEAGAEAVKIEGGAARCELVERIVGAEVPVIGHLGLTGQDRSSRRGAGPRRPNVGGRRGLDDCAGRNAARACGKDYVGSWSSDDRDRRGTGLRWADSGLSRHGELDLFRASEVRPPIRRRRCALSLRH